MEYEVRKRFEGEHGRLYQPGERIRADEARRWRVLDRLIDQRYLMICDAAGDNGERPAAATAPPSTRPLTGAAAKARATRLARTAAAH